MHECSFLTFDYDMPKEEIQAKCDYWGNCNADLMERGGRLLGLDRDVMFTDKVFDDWDSADRYLMTTLGKYLQTAVAYKDKDGKMRWMVACEVHC